MMRAEPWQTGEICGPTKAQALTKPGVVVALLKKAKRPLLVVGHLAMTTKHGKGNMVDYAIQLASKAGIPVVATAHTVKEFREKGFKAASINAMEVTQLLTDPKWKGPDGKGPHDLVLVMGLPYYMEWCMLSAVMNFAPQIKTVTLDRYYHPHATWSFPNLREKEWHQALDMILTQAPAAGGGA